MRALGELLANPFAPVGVDRLEFDVRVEFRRVPQELDAHVEVQPVDAHPERSASGSPRPGTAPAGQPQRPRGDRPSWGETWSRRWSAPAPPSWWPG